MNRKEIVFDSSAGGGRRVKGFIYEAPESRITLQICHGMAEHMGRYEQMIEYLNGMGITVCAIDMLGHGETSKLNKDPLGYFGDVPNAYECIFEDNLIFATRVSELTGQSPSVLFGHSMGSFVVRCMYSRERYATKYKAFVFCSTKGPEPLASFGLALSKFLCAIGQDKKQGKLIDKLAFGAYNSHIPNPRTDSDWLTTDEKEIDKYIADPLSGFMFTNGGFKVMLSLVKEQQSKSAADSFCGKPCLMPYGEEDPVTGWGKGVVKVVEQLKSKGVEVTARNFGPYRHELMNEPVREEFFKFVGDFVLKFV